MAVRVNFNRQQIIKRFDRVSQQGIELVSQQVLKDSNVFVRKDSGQLEGSSIRASDFKKGLLVWDTPYARKVYYLGNPSRDVNNKASLMWFEVAKSRFSKDWIKVMQRTIDRGF